MAIRIEVELDERGVVKDVRRVEQSLNDLNKAGGNAARGIDTTNSRLLKLQDILIAGGVIVGLQNMLAVAKELPAQFINTAASFERLKISLDTITKGRGDEWFEKLNSWAINMPITTQEAVAGFQRLRAMGMQPTIADMEILVDTTSALGGSTDVFNGIVLALGQIQTKGKLMSQEIRQLAERGIPAYEILREKLGLTGEDLEKTGQQAIDAGTAIRALMEGMADRFAGQSKRMMDSATGLTEIMKENWQDFQRLMMEGAPFDFVKERMKEINGLLKFFNRGLRAGEKIESYENFLKGMGVRGARGNWDIVGKYEYTDAQLGDARRMMQEQKRFYSELNAMYQPVDVAETSPLFDPTSERYLKNKRDREMAMWRAYAERDKRLSGVQTLTDEQIENQKFIAYQQMISDFAEEDAKKYREALDRAYEDGTRFWDDQERKAQEYRESIIDIGATWGAMFDNALQQGGSFAENLKNQFASIGTSLLIRGSFAAIASLMSGGTFSAGFGAILKSSGLFPGFASGGYTGSTGGYVHPNEYVSNSRTVDYFGTGLFEALAKIADGRGGNYNYQTNINVSSHERQQLMESDDYAFADRVNRLVAARMIRLPESA